MDSQLMVKDMEEQKIELSEESKKLGNYTVDFINSFYPSYGMNNKYIEEIEKEDSLTVLNDFTFYRISECTVDNVDDIFGYFAEKLKRLFTTAYSIKKEVCYGIVSSEGETSLVIGVNPKNENDTIKCIIEGLLPGVKLDKFTKKFKNSQYKNSKKEDCDKDRYVGCISGVPTLKIDGEYQHKDISALMRSLNGQDYTIMVLCKPLDEDTIQNKINQAIKIQDGCFEIAKKTIALQQGVSVGQTNSVSHSEGTTESIAKTKSRLRSIVVARILNANKSKTITTGENLSDSYGEAITASISNGKSISGEIQNGFAIELMNMAENIVERLKTGRSIGMWQSIVTYSSDSEIAHDIIQGSLYSEMASGNPEVLPPVVFSFKDSCGSENKDKTKIHTQQIIIPKGFFTENGNSPLCSLVTSEELCGICTIPTDNTVGFQIREEKGYALNCEQYDNGIELGAVSEYDRPLSNVKYKLTEADLNKHTFVCGITGCGKTNTVKQILRQTDKPFLVIEPVKKEYRNLETENLNIYTLGRPEINCIRINPFYIMPGISPQQHIDMLKDLFSASFALYGPMPYIVEQCLYNVYIKKGWNLTLGFHPYLVDTNKDTQLLFSQKSMKENYKKEAHKYVFPTMQDLKEEVDYYIENETTYEGEVKGNIRSAIKARVDSLCVGAKGYMFNTNNVIEFEKLFDSKSVLELEGLSDDADKAFALGLLIIYINEYRQIQHEVDSSKGLKHLLVIEEAHRLLKNVSTEKNEDLGNPKGKAVEHFANLLAEMRAYGQGVIVAEQIPSKLAPEVIKNSSNKIIHRIVAKDDQEIISNTIGVCPEDAIYLGNQKVGFALCHKEGMAKPVMVKVAETISSGNVLDVALYNKDLTKKLFAINCSILSNELHKEIQVWAIRTLVSLMYQELSADVLEGLEHAVDMIRHEAFLRNITMIPQIEKKECILNVIAEHVNKLLMAGVFSNYIMPDDKLVNELDNTIKNTKDEKTESLNVRFEEFYGQSSKKKVIEIVSGLVSAKFVEENNIVHYAKEFSLNNSILLGREVQQFLEKGGKRCL